MDVNFSTWQDYWELGKPRVVVLMMLTALIGMLMAQPEAPPLSVLLWGNIGIALCAVSAAAMNHVLDRDFDRKMSRTQARPLASGRISPMAAFIYAFATGIIGGVILWTQVNILTAFLTLCSLVGYAVVYTVWLKHLTPQNIVLGGLAGASPPLLGWTAVSDDVSAHALLLVMIIFTWTPPHFWALALHRKEEYSAANIPMLPVTHGENYTRKQIACYTFLLLIVSLLPFAAGMSGVIYFCVALFLGFIYVAAIICMFVKPNELWDLWLFHYSIWYLALLFSGMLLDHYWRY